MTDWKLTNSQAYKLNVSELRFVLEQADKMLKETLVISDNIVSRVTTMITIMSAIFATIVGYLIDKISKGDAFSTTALTAIVGGGYVFWLIYLLYQNIKGSKYNHDGAIPSSLLNEDVFDSYFEHESAPKDAREKHLLLIEIENYDKRIKFNTKLNQKRWDSFHFTLKGVICTPFILTAVYFLLAILFGL